MVRRTGHILLALEVFIVGPAILGAAFLNRFFEIALGIAAVFWILRYLVRREWSVRTSLDIPLTFMVLMVPVAWLVSARLEVTRVQVYRLALSVAMFYAVVNWITGLERLRWAVRGVLLAGWGVTAAGVLSIPRWPQGKVFFLPRSLLSQLQQVPVKLPDEANPNILAGYLILFAVFSWVLWSAPRRTVHWLDRGGGFVTWLVITGTSVLFQSRGAVIALVVGTLVYVLLRVGQIDKRFVLGISLVLVAGAIYGWLLWRTSVQSLPQWRSAVDALSKRQVIWAHAVYLIQSFAFTGVGLGLFSPVVDVLYPFSFTSPGQIPHAHNLFLQAAVDFGIPGGVAWGALVIATTWSAWEIYRTGASRYVQTLGIVFLAVQTTLIVHGMVDAIPWVHSRPVPLLWGIWGVLMGAWRLRHQVS